MKMLLGMVPLLAMGFLISFASKEPQLDITPDTSVDKVLEMLGDTPSPNKPKKGIKGVSVENGRKLVLEGISTDPSGKRTSKQSKHFVCTTCHNVKREDPDLRVSDPQARLEYVTKNGMPLLQGTALYGVVNRTSFYNDDYYKKYGTLVEKAQNDIREAIQLCAIECSQGRPLYDWEMESVLTYLWTIDLKVKDLILSEEEIQMIETAVDDKVKKDDAIELIRSRYLSASPATFADAPKDRKAGYPGLKGDPENGKMVYEAACLHCHEKKRYSMFNLDDSEFSLDHLAKNFPKYTRYSTYKVSRYGTKPMAGKRSYMPQYTLEKMSHQQLEDLRAYVEKGE